MLSLNALLPWTVISVLAVPVSAARPDMPGVYVYSCCVPLPAYDGVRCSAGQGTWRQSHQLQSSPLSVNAPTEIKEKKSKSNNFSSAKSPEILLKLPYYD